MSTAADVPALDAWALAGQIKQRGKELGFDLVGVAPAEASRYRAYFRQWLDDGQAGTMDYLARRFDERTDPSVYLSGAKSVVCVGMNYYVPLEAAGERPDDPRGRVARYALGDDYHELMKGRLHVLADWMRQQAPASLTRACVDTAPVMEKDVAARAGVGWVGKNTCVIHERVGSWLLLGEIVTTLALPADEPAVDRCGSCRRCIEACPTDAIAVEGYRLDARRCISYLTIEHRDEPIPAGLAEGIGEWLYGCDICQDVCPWNRAPPVATEPAMQPRFVSGSLSLAEVLAWGTQEYAAALKGSAMKRVKLPVLQRNAQRVLANSIRREATCGRD